MKTFVLIIVVILAINTIIRYINICTIAKMRRHYRKMIDESYKYSPEGYLIGTTTGLIISIFLYSVVFYVLFTN